MTVGCILSGYRINTVGFPTTFLTFACITAFITAIFLAVQFHMYLKKDNEVFEERLPSLSMDGEYEDWDDIHLLKKDNNGG